MASNHSTEFQQVTLEATLLVSSRPGRQFFSGGVSPGGSFAKRTTRSTRATWRKPSCAIIQVIPMRFASIGTNLRRGVTRPLVYLTYP